MSISDDEVPINISNEDDIVSSNGDVVTTPDEDTPQDEWYINV